MGETGPQAGVPPEPQSPPQPALARSALARWREWSTPILDAAIIVALMLITGAPARPEALVAGAAMLASLASTGALRPAVLRGPDTERCRLFASITLAGCLVSVHTAVLGNPSRLGQALGTLGLMGLAVAIARCCTRLARWAAVRRGRGVEAVVVVGEFERATRLAADLERDARGAVHVVSLVCPPAERELPARVGTASVVRGGVDAALMTTLRSGAGRVVVADGQGLSADEFSELAWQLRQSAARVRMDFATGLQGPGKARLSWVAGRGTAVVAVGAPSSPSGLKAGAKRTMDVLLTVPGLLVLTPVLVLLAAVVRLDSAGPVFFKQERVGRDGRVFTMYKFRTMRPDAEARLAELAASNEASGPLFKLTHDPRITRAGRWLRSTSLDELPQLLNVLRGHMSLVGPRPALPSEVRDYDETASKRLRVKPGLTGPWQVGGRSELGWEDGLRLDLGYVHNWSIGGDIVLLAKTVSAVASRRGAY